MLAIILILTLSWRLLLVPCSEPLLRLVWGSGKLVGTFEGHDGALEENGAAIELRDDLYQYD